MLLRVEIGTSIFLIAVGAVLRYAVTGDVSGIRIHVVGLILIVVGVLGLVLSLVHAYMVSRQPRGYDYDDRPRRRTR